ncbi:hypothetical protein HETIRDRAFT_440671, partial [Heterobasidion irregulare TC 32-1]
MEMRRARARRVAREAGSVAGGRRRSVRGRGAGAQVPARARCRPDETRRSRRRLGFCLFLLLLIMSFLVVVALASDLSPHAHSPALSLFDPHFSLSLSAARGHHARSHLDGIYSPIHPAFLFLGYTLGKRDARPLRLERLRVLCPVPSCSAISRRRLPYIAHPRRRGERTDPMLPRTLLRTLLRRHTPHHAHDCMTLDVDFFFCLPTLLLRCDAMGCGRAQIGCWAALGRARRVRSAPVVPSGSSPPGLALLHRLLAAVTPTAAGWLAGRKADTRVRIRTHMFFFYGLRLTRYTIYTIEASGYVGRAFMTVCVCTVDCLVRVCVLIHACVVTL